MPRNQFTCLIPCYNESKRLTRTLEIITQISEFTSIICIDDGSTDPITKKILSEAKQLFPQIQFLKKQTNSGKSEAIQLALEKIKTNWILLLDADLKFLKPDEISQALELVKKNHNKLDMLILRRAPYNEFVKAIRHDILMSGERIMRSKDLKKVYEQRPFSGYQLEVAINHYMLERNKRVFWFQTSLANTYKHRKWKLKNSIKKYHEEMTSYTSYAGTKAYLKQIESFCKNSIFEL